MTITEFIEARLSEVELAATMATPGPWYRAIGTSHVEPWKPDWQTVYSKRGTQIAYLGHEKFHIRNADHIALNDPAHVLAWVTALRFIVAGHAPTVCQHIDAGTYHEQCSICSEVMSPLDGPEGDLVGVEGDWPCPTNRAIAAIWLGHPDFESEWA